MTDRCLAVGKKHAVRGAQVPHCMPITHRMDDSQATSVSLQELLQPLANVIVRDSSHGGATNLRCNDESSRRSKVTFLYPFVSSPENLRLVNSYGDMDPMYLSQDIRELEIRDTDFESPDLKEDLYNLTKQCIDSLDPESAIECQELSLSFQQVLFPARKPSLRNKVLHAPCENECYVFPIGIDDALVDIGDTHMNCYSYLDDLVQVITQCGASLTGRETSPEELIVKLPDRQRLFTVDEEEFHFGSSLHLNSSDLSLASWTAKSKIPMRCYMVPNHQFGGTLRLSSKIRHSVSLADLKDMEGEVDSIAVDIFSHCNLGDLLTRSDDGHFITEDRAIFMLQHRRCGTVYNFEMEGIRFTLKSRPTSYYRTFRSSGDRLELVSEIGNQCVLAFSLSDDRQAVADAVTRVSETLLRDLWREEGLLFLPTPRNMYINGLRLPCRTVQPLRRLRFENDDLGKLLGLPAKIHQTTLEGKYFRVMRLLENYMYRNLEVIGLVVPRLQRKLLRVAESEGVISLYLDEDDSDSEDWDMEAAFAMQFASHGPRHPLL